MRVIPLFCRVSYDGQSFLLMLQVSFPLQLVLTKYCAILKSAEIKAVIEEKAFFWKFSAWIFYVPPTDWLMWRLRINLRILVIAPDCEKSSHKKRKKNGSSSVLCERNNRAGEVMEGGMESGDHTSFFFFPKMAPQHIASFAVLKALIKDTESSLQESSSPSTFSLLHPINVGKWLPTTECQIITGSPPRVKKWKKQMTLC